MYYSAIPTKLDRNNYSKQNWIKARTQELYDMLPQTTLKDRMSYTDIRDEIIVLNDSFFGYVAKNTYVTDPMATYEDKFQSARLNFCSMWAKYKFSPVYSKELEYSPKGVYSFEDYTFYNGELYECRVPEEVTGEWNAELWKRVKTYRSDLSFAVFFKPRLKECITRELNTIKYSVRRQVCMKAASQLGKHWGQLTKEDISKVQLPPEEMQTLESIFSTKYDTPFEDTTAVKAKPVQADFITIRGIDELYTEKYDSLEDLIMHEMIEEQCKLDDAHLLKMAQMYDIPYVDLEKARPIGEEKLRLLLEEAIDIKDSFESGNGFEDDPLIED